MPTKQFHPWPAEKAWKWYQSGPWPCGFNYIPANAISYTEMWMEYSFDATLIDNELKLAQDIGFNSLRVVLPFIVWEHEPEAFKSRFEQFLDICHKRKLSVMPALFDDCCFGPLVNPVFGPQPKVIPGWYGNGWTPSPGHDIVRNPAQWHRLEPYVKDIVSTFRDDSRLWVWDLYNEPTNGVLLGQLSVPVGDISIELAKKVFQWVREVNPSQPLTVGTWNDNDQLNAMATGLSDIITFHNYEPPEKLTRRIEQIKRHGRPVICTEWLNRGAGSTVADCLPIFLREGVGVMHWGLVNGKTQTHLNWRHLPGDPDPELAQHDLFRPDHSPYDVVELAYFKAAIAHAPVPV